MSKHLFACYAVTMASIHWSDIMTTIHSAWLTANEAASYLKVKPHTLLTWARAGKLKGHILSGTRRHVWRFTQVDLDAMLTEQSVAVNGRIH